MGRERVLGSELSVTGLAVEREGGRRGERERGRGGGRVSSSSSSSSVDRDR